MPSFSDQVRGARKRFVLTLVAVVALGVDDRYAARGARKGKARAALRPRCRSRPRPRKARVSGTVTVSGTAGGGHVRLASVEISVDGGPFRLAAGTTRWSSPLDSTTLADGKHEIAARAMDGVGNTTGVSVFVAVANTPSDTKAPSGSDHEPLVWPRPSRASVSILGTASDDVALEKIELSIDGSAYRPAEGTSSWSYSLDTSAYRGRRAHRGCESPRTQRGTSPRLQNRSP